MASMLTVARPTLRKLRRLDVLRLQHIEEQMPPPRWTQQDFLTALLAEGGGGTVAECTGKAVAYLLYDAPPASAGVGLLRLADIGRWCLSRAGQARAPRDVDLLHLAVHPHWRQQGIGRALLNDFHAKLWLPGDRVRTVIPQSHDALREFLEKAGYQVVRRLPGYFATEDGDEMLRQGR
jgi:ribosomal protein S18 acetylase RimI-like enzyme